MILRRDPETVPAAVTVQIVRRGSTDRYGAERGYGHAQTRPRPRPVVTRNGLPVRAYRYRGTGRSMTPTEAQQRLGGGR